MQIIAIASQKGGSGKTTLAGHLAVAAQEAGHGPVVLIDADPQASLTGWWNARQSTTPLFAQAAPAKLAAGIERIRGLGVKLLIIDTPPAIADTMIDAIRIADLVVIPVRPSPHDLRSAGTTIEIVERHAKPAVFVVNAATPRARITTEAVVALSQHGTLAPVILHQRTGFAAAMIDGRTVMEIPGESRSVDEVKKLWTYISVRLGHTVPAPLPALLEAPAAPAEGDDEACAA
ncbi:MAG TPA: ParA family protein [Stellaceae bacterium]|nr:ParA family protein [Stellaceae bacterium]